MHKCIVVADDDPSIATAVAHLLISQFDTPIVKQRLEQDLRVFVSGEICSENVLAAEIMSIPLQIDTLQDDVSHENVLAVITVCGFSGDDQRVSEMLENNVALLQLGEFHCNQVDFGNFSERVANQPFTIALADATYELGNFIINSIAPCTT